MSAAHAIGSAKRFCAVQIRAFSPLVDLEKQLRKRYCKPSVFSEKSLEIRSARVIEKRVSAVQNSPKNHAISAVISSASRVNAGSDIAATAARPPSSSFAAIADSPASRAQPAQSVVR